jgi:hypothetical protein
MPIGTSLRLSLVALALSLVCGQAVAAEAGLSVETPAGVVELFTSQGCNSCPPADRFFTELAGKDDIVALAYHVDYWDYLGWHDTLSSKDNTERQYAYMRAFGGRSIYTPQAVINGRAHVNGANRAAVTGALTMLKSSGNGMLVPIRVAREGDGVVIETGDADPGADLPDSAHVILAYFEPPQTVEIGRGRNRGRQMTYWNAVSSIQTAGMWHGKAQRYELPASEVMKKGGCAVLLQSGARDGLPGPIIGAAFVNRTKP